MTERVKPLLRQLQAKGYPGTLEAFYVRLQACLTDHFAGFTADKLVCRPLDALKFIQLTNAWLKDLGCTDNLEHETILRTLLNLRKQKLLPRTTDA